jgi:hypothetical protein
MNKLNKSNPRYRVYNSVTKLSFYCDNLSKTFDRVKEIMIMERLRNKGDSCDMPIFDEGRVMRDFYTVTLLREPDSN